ncbi:MAG: UPF0236 family protein [Elusimicrobia bacterium]|nr:UPF0236 family protein [Elusimicrobiota bacterium]
MTKDMTLSELAVFAESLGRELAQAMLTSRLEEDPRTHPQEARCRHCTGRWRFQNTAQRRVIQTAVGPIEYRRAYGVCDRCGHTGAPLDEALGIPPFGPSVETRKKICHAAVVGRSFEAGREILQVHSNVDLSAKHVRWIAGTEGGRVRKERDQERTSYQAGARPASTTQAPRLLVIAADGGRVQTRSADPRERWKEDKIGIVYDATATPQPHVPRGEYEGAKAKTKTYVATLADWEAMGWLLRVEAERRGYARAENRLFVADGARSIRELKNLHFPEATFILDWAHAAQHLSDCAKAAFGEGTPDALRWFEDHKELLWEGKSDRIIADLGCLSDRLGPPTETDSEASPRRVLHQNATSYFPNNQTAMDYPRFRANGWPIGSGVAEGAVKQFGLRMKGSEKFWNGFQPTETQPPHQTGAEEMLALCALYHSQDGRWDRHWRERAQPR